MSKRRSMDDALTPDEAAFLHSALPSASTKPAAKSKGKPKPPPNAKVAQQLPPPAETPPTPTTQPEPVAPTPPQILPAPAPHPPITPPVEEPQSPAPAIPPMPTIPASMDGGLLAITTRIEPSLVTALFRATVERKIQRRKPFTQREIVSDAIREWLERNGFQT